MMIDLQILMAIISVLILFLFSIRRFSEEVQLAAGKRFKSTIRKFTSTPLKGTIAGAGVTALIQSSSATTVILIGLVDAGLISFRNSLGIIFGANIGTTITSQLVSLKLSYIAPIFVIAGFLVELFSKKHRIVGRAIFYFGLIFFSLYLVSSYLEPISQSPKVVEIFSSLSNIFLAILAGAILTFLVQSSSITSGLVIVLASQGLLTLASSIGIIFGANIGTTTTALIASIGSTKAGKKTAIAHFLFNVIGVIIFLPILKPFMKLVQSLGGSLEREVANAHLIFNLIIAVIFLVSINLFHRLVEKSYHFEKKELSGKKVTIKVEKDKKVKKGHQNL